MKKTLLFAFTLLLSIPAFSQSAYNYQKRTLFEKLPITTKDIVFLGNSITDGGEWAEIFGMKNIKNRGISADRAVWLADRLDPIVNGQPKKLFLLIGTNDLSAGISIDEIVDAIDGVVGRFQNESPKTKLYLQSVFPVDVTKERYAKAQDRNEQIVELNSRIAELAAERGATYIDIHSALKDSAGNLSEELSNDGLHLMGEGYMVWKEILEPYIK
jgi:lysophospholipase L1-like esterase